MANRTRTLETGRPVSGGARQRADGRVERGARNRASIVDAVYELVSEGERMPTAEQVAARAQVGTRTVFRHFDDMEGLHAELHARVAGEVFPLLDEPRCEGSLAERIREVVERRARLYERIRPFRSSGELHRWRSPFLQRASADANARLRSDLRAALPELRDAPFAVVETAALLTSPEAWERLRADQRLSITRAREVLEQALRAQLERGD